MASLAEISPHTLRTSSSCYSIPNAPRIFVPPPTEHANVMPPSVLRVRSDAGLPPLPDTTIAPANTPQNWTYERRHVAQPILPFLYLGPMTAAKDAAWLARERITAILGIRHQAAVAHSDRPSSVFHRVPAPGIPQDILRVASHTQLASLLPSTSAWIAQHVRTTPDNPHATATHNPPGKVLVFCESGNERAACVVAAFIMDAFLDIDFIAAMQLCQAQRFCANFDDPAKRMLQSYGDLLRARRQVHAQTQLLPPRGAAALKRRRDDDDIAGDADEADDEVMRDVGAAGDAERFEGRSFAPFADVLMGDYSDDELLG